MGIELGVGIKVDPADSAAKADSVEAALHRTEDRGKAVAASMAGVAGSFKSLATALEQQRAALERNNASHARLNSTTFAAAQGFNKMAEAIQREQQMLERIHGPTKRYADELQTLDSLLRRDAISTSEYADQVRRLNHELEGTPKNSNLPRAAAGGGGAGLSAFRGAAAAVGVTIGASQVIDLADGYTQLQNRLRQMTPDQAAANELLEKLSGIASRSRSDIGATTDAFASMSRATKQLGLSQSETLGVTETLSKLVTASGKSAAESSAGLLQFGQALSSGRLQGDELRSVFETMPTVVEALMSSLGKTQAQLREMGAAGQITSKVMIDALKGAASSADASLGKTIPTIGQHFTQMKNTLITELGPALQGIGPIVGHVGDVLVGTIGVIKTGLIPVQLLGEGLGALGPAGVIAAAALTAIALGNPIGIIATAAIGAAAALNALTEAMGMGGLFDNLSSDVIGSIDQFKLWEEKINDANRTLGRTPEMINKSVQELTELNIRIKLGAEAADAFHKALLGVASSDPWASAAEKSITLLDRINQGITIGQATWAKIAEKKHATAHRKEIDEYASTLAKIHGPQEGAIKQLNILGQLHMNNAITLEEYNTASAKHRDLLVEIGMLQVKSQTGGINVDPAFAAQVRGLSVPSSSQEVFDLEAFRENMRLTRQGIEEGQHALDQLNLERHISEAQALGNAFRPVGDAIREAFMGGTLSAQKFEDALKQVAWQLAIAGIGQGIGGQGGAFFGSLMGGANGFDHVVGRKRGPELPGFANGGNVTVGGSGGTDSKLAMFKVTPGESIHVRTPAQQAAERSFASRVVPGELGQALTPPPSMSSRDVDRIVAAITSSSGRGEFNPTFVVQDDKAALMDSMSGHDGRRMMVKLNRSRGRRG